MIVKRILPNSNTVTFCNVNCPKCNHIAKLMDYHIENKETIECPVCGYQSELNRTTNENVIRYGYGALYAEFINKPFVYILFDEPISQKDKEELSRIFDDYFLVKEKSYFYMYEPFTNELQVLNGNEPQTFERYVEDQRDQMDYERFLASYRYQSLCTEDYEPFE